MDNKVTHGRTHGDTYLGEYTFIASTGCSTIDLLVINYEGCSRVKDRKALHLLHPSSHMSVVFNVYTEKLERESEKRSSGHHTCLEWLPKKAEDARSFLQHLDNIVYLQR
ncbi:hypothetical protein QE152_g12689 [Popillia japonica]|uniref:Uncharacterized protein n=1 Tax=Popillia japonica TaxID=7064 RepID=A0AAW1LQB7_POPJA